MLKIAIIPVVILMLGVCSASFAATDQHALFQPFVVYKDKGLPTSYAPSGYMPTGGCVTVNDAWTQDCQEGKSCIQVIYDTLCSAQDQGWAGVYWLYPANNWGDHKGRDLTGATKLVFWARGKKGGEVIAEFKMGGVGVNSPFPDSDTVGIGPVTLSTEWREYSIDLRGRDLSSISGGFAWIADVGSNPDSCTFFLDDIHFE